MRRNRNSRQWLVNQHEEHVKGQKCVLSPGVRVSPTYPSADTEINDHYLQFRHHQHQVEDRMQVMHFALRNNGEASQRQGKIRATSQFRMSERSRDRFYQILEVLLAIVLVNFLVCRLTQLPLALAAYGKFQSGSGYSSSNRHNAEVNFDESRPSFLDSDEYDDPYYRQPHSIGGSAFGYNGLQLQHNLDDSLLRSQNFKISPKPCSIGRIEGTCMFVWECIKSEGRHVGMCVDSFMFGSCCAHNYTDNIVLPNTFSYTRPTKPIGMGSMNHRPRPPQHPHKPSIMGMTTIERPHGAGTLVIRPSGPHHQGPLGKPKPSLSSTSAAPATSSTTTDGPPIMWPSSGALNDLQSSASIPSATTVNHQQHWHLTTEPNFITKPRPPAWDKPGTFRPKPPKPSKKPTTPADWHTTQTQLTYASPSYSTYSTRKPTTTHPPTQFTYSTSSWKTSTTTTALTTTAEPTMKPTTTTKPQVVVAQSSRPTTVPGSTTNYVRPTSSSNIDAAPSTFPSSTTTTTSKRPITTTAAVAAGVLPTKTTHRPISSSQPYTSSVVATTTIPVAASVISSPSALSTLTSNGIESNEIGDSTDDSSSATIKTVSAARSECGVPVLTRPETRIVGGKSAAFGRWPWQVSVRRTSFFGFSSTHRCGGALINENWIATAGHCVDDLLISQIRIRVGEYDFAHVQEQLPYIERGVSKKVVHPQYNFFTYEYDLALVKMEQPLEFAPHVSPICLPQTDSLLIGMNATVTGWGRLSEGGTLPSVLQEVSVPIVSNDNCKSMFLRAGRQEFIPEIFLCAGYENGGQDSCQGDSGGPLQVKSQNGHYFLAGIISWGIGCAEANLPGVCTRISKFVPWIMENVT
ncbi:serine proteinase stubble [Haematobia irritans]|uniref:serine proteinase stubble n=1 Tax=Haematobia irritans TaxID=7368 RepID=UPI003F5042B0